MFERIAAALPRRGGRLLRREDATGEGADQKPAKVARDAQDAAPAANDTLLLRVPNVYVLHEQPAGVAN